MNYKDYFRKFESTPEYKETKEKFGLILDIGDEILRLRIEKDWSQAELAVRAGTKQANISRLESGLSNPSISFLQKVAKAFNARLSCHFEEFQSLDIKNTDVQDQGICVPNWPKGKPYGINTMTDTTKDTTIDTTTYH